jgi:6-phosphogluconolactonase
MRSERCVFLCWLLALPMCLGSEMRVFFGTYTRNTGAEGIYSAVLDTETGTLSEPQLAAKAQNPTYLAFHPSGRVLYAVGETAEGPALRSFHVEGNVLRPAVSQPIGGAGPCHLAVDPSGRLLATANYSGGSVSIFPLDGEGTPGPEAALFVHQGSGPDSARQEKPHAHGIEFSPDGRIMYAADLGTDEIRIYRVQDGSVVPSEPPAVAAAPGAGPRHLVVAPGGRHLHVVNELNNTLATYLIEGANLLATDTQPLLPARFEGFSKAAAIAITPDGRFVFASNRGYDSIAQFRRDAETGGLTPAGHVETGAREPRGMGLSPCGRWLLVGHHYAGGVQVYRVDVESGTLEATGDTAPIHSPVCVVFPPQRP